MRTIGLLVIIIFISNITCAQKGSKVPQDTRYTTGTSGVRRSIGYKFSPAINIADPGPGIFGYNNDTLSKVSWIVVDNNDITGEDQSKWYSTWDDTTGATARGSINIVEFEGKNVNAFNFTGVFIRENGYWKFPVEYISGNLPVKGATYYYIFNRIAHKKPQRETEPPGEIPAPANQVPVPAEAVPVVQVVQPPQPAPEPQVVSQPQPAPEPLIIQQPQPVQETQVIQQPQPVQETQVIQQPQPVQETQVIQQSPPAPEPQVIQQPQPVQEPQVIQQPQPVAEPVMAEEPVPPQKPQVTRKPPDQQTRVTQPARTTQPVQTTRQPQATQTTQTTQTNQTTQTTQATQNTQTTTAQQNKPVSQTTQTTQTTKPAQTQSTQTTQNTGNTQQNPVPANQVTRTNQPVVVQNIYETQQVDRRKCYRGIIEAGYALGVGEYGISNFRFNFINGINIGKFSSIGLGIGYRRYFEQFENYTDRSLFSPETQIPVFLDIRTSFSTRKVTPYLAIGLGGSAGYDTVQTRQEGFFFTTSGGIWFNISRRFAVFAGAAYEVQRLEYLLIADDSHFKRNTSSVSLNIGIAF